MATTSRTLPPMPPPNIKIVEPDGSINRYWYDWLKAVEQIVRILRTEV